MKAVRVRDDIDAWRYARRKVRRDGTWRQVRRTRVRVPGPAWDGDSAPVPPVIVSHPAPLTVLEDANASFTVIAVGATSYQWRRSDAGGGAWTDVAGATNPTITVTAVQLVDNGDRYLCRVTGPGGTTDSDPALLTVTAAGTPARFTDAGLELDGAPGVYALTPHVPALVATDQLRVWVLATLPSWTAYYGNDGGHQQAFVAKWGGGPTGNQRAWNLSINDSGQIVVNLSKNGTGTAATATTIPGGPPAPGSTWLIGFDWNGHTVGARAAGTLNIYAIPATPASVPPANPTPIRTTTLLALGGAENLHPSADDVTFGAINKGTSAPMGGTLHYVEFTHSIAAGAAPALRAVFSDAVVGAQTYTEVIAGRVITLVGGDNAPVGMPNGDEIVNVGPQAAVLGHTPIAWANLAAQVDTMVITEADALAAPPIAVTHRGVVYNCRLFERLNVLVGLRITATTPVYIRDSRLPAHFVPTGSTLITDYCLGARTALRAGDTVPNEAFMDTVIAATTWGAGAEQVTGGSDGKFVDAWCTNTGKVIHRRALITGYTDCAFTGNGAELSDYYQCWGTSFLWLAHDPNRKNFAVDTTHNDLIKVNAGCNTLIDEFVVDMWQILKSEVAGLDTTYFRSPHHGKLATDPTWPAQRPENPGQHFLPVGVVNVSQAGGQATNVLVRKVTVRGPHQRTIYLLKKPGIGYPKTVTVTGLNVRTAPTGSYWSAGNDVLTTDDWRITSTGPDANRDPNGNVIAPTGGPNVIDSSTYTPRAC